MAIQHPFTTASGVVLSQAYHKVLSSNLQRQPTSGSSTSDTMIGMVNIFRDSTARDLGLTPVQTYQFNVIGGDYTRYFGIPVLDQTNVNNLYQTYMWMKTQTNLNGIDYTHDSTDV